MEIIKQSDGQRFISAAGGEVMLLVRPMMLDVIEDIKLLNRSQHLLILKDSGIDSIPESIEDYEVLKATMSFVQNTWYAAMTPDGVVPTGVTEGHQKRLEHFAAAVDRARKAPKVIINPAPAREPKAPKPPKAPREPKVAKPDATYALTVSRTDAKLVKALESITDKSSHDDIIAHVMGKNPVQQLAEIVATVQATGLYQTNDPLEKSVRYHLGKLVGKGWVVES